MRLFWWHRSIFHCTKPICR